MVTTIATLLHSQSKSRNQLIITIVCRDIINCKVTIVFMQRGPDLNAEHRRRRRGGGGGAGGAQTELVPYAYDAESCKSC